MADIIYRNKICSKCKKEVKSNEIFHIIINKGEPNTNLSFYDDAYGHGWTAEVTYYKENVDSMLLLCEECKNKLSNFICF